MIDRRGRLWRGILPPKTVKSGDFALFAQLDLQVRRCFVHYVIQFLERFFAIEARIIKTDLKQTIFNLLTRFFRVLHFLGVCFTGKLICLF